MKKIKVIDLLNKIANGEEVPKKIKWGDHILTWCVYEHKALDELDDPNLFKCAGGTISRRLLNDEVEIIEDYKKLYDEIIEEYGTASIEDKKIEKLKKLNTDYYMEREKYGALTNEEIVLDIQTLKNYINKLVDKENGE